MIAIRDFIQQIIYISVVVIIIELILPKGNTKKYVYVILSLFILLNVISPIINVLRDIDMQQIYEDILANIPLELEKNSFNAVEVFSEYKNEKVLEEAEDKLLVEIEEKLRNMNIELKELDLDFTDEYEFEKLKITINNLDYLGDNKKKKILDIITMLEDEYEIKTNAIVITEEAK